MTKQKIFLIVQSALCVLIAVLLSASAVRIFIDGSAWQAAGHPTDWIYTREKVAASLAPILPLILASIAMTVFGLVKGIKDEDADTPVQDTELMRDLRCARIAEPSEEMAKERSMQKKLKIGGWAGFAVCMVPILLFVTNAGNFALADAEGLDQSIIAMIAFIVPWTALGLACLIVTTVLQEKSMQREMDAATNLLKEKKDAAAAPGAAKAEQTAATVKSTEAAKAPGTAGAEKAVAKAGSQLHNTPEEVVKRRILLRRILMAAAVVFIILGVMNGGMKDVLVKAIKICTECVGLG